MATIKPVDNLASSFTRMSPGTSGRKFIQWSLDARRALIFAPKKPKKGYVNPDIKNYRDELHNKQISKDVSTYNPVSSPPFKTSQDIQHDVVWVIVKDAWGNNPPLYKIRLPFIPREIRYNSESTFATIKPIGRNTSKYHFTGSEDKVEFEIDWFSFDPYRQDVIENCRLIESLSKSDGYMKNPPTILLQWGNDNHLFKDHEFIVLNAPYRLTQFNKAQLINNEVQSTHLMPIQAYQKLTLGRISSTNLTTKEIQYISKFELTSNESRRII